MVTEDDGSPRGPIGDASRRRIRAGRPRAWAIASGFAAALASGCGAEAGTSHTLVRDSAGVRIVENEAPDSASLSSWSIAAEPTVDVGLLEGTEDETLFRVVGAARLSDGRLAIANAGTSEVRYYGPDGGHLVSAGGEGGGPGEFQRITRLIRMPGDSVAVEDLTSRRLSVMAPDGSFAREVPNATSGSMLTVVARRPDGTWLATQGTMISPGQEGIQGGLMRPDGVWVIVPPAGGAADTVVEAPGTERVLHVGRSGARITSIEITTPPFGRTTNVLPAGDDLVVATQDAAQVELYGPDGGLRVIFRTGVPLRPVTPEMVGDFLERRYADLPPDQRRDAIQAGKDAPAGEFVPPYGDVTLDRAGNLWIQDYDGLSGENRWTVYTADGTPLARIALPPHFTPYDIGEDWILGKELDELEVEHVRLYAMRTAPPGR